MFAVFESLAGPVGGTCDDSDKRKWDQHYTRSDHYKSRTNAVFDLASPTASSRPLVPIFRGTMAERV